MEERIGHYSIVSELGRGGMGVVYKAHEESLNRFVALKVLGQHLSEDESYVERFKREAQSAAALNHPNIVQVYSIDDFDGRHCFAMEYVQGSSIQQMIKASGPMEPAAAARLILQAASGLGAAHSHGIIHRDIKPANLMVDERGLVKIADFGLALLAAGATRLTATGMFMGTPGYLSPEQCLDEDVDHRADIYSLGVTFYEMLTGITPFKADSPLALLRQIIDVEPKDVGELRPEVPEALRIILRKMMTKKREERYADCAPLVADLQGWLETVGAGGDLSAVVATVVSKKAGPVDLETSATGEDLNTDPTLRVDSAQLPGNQPPPPPPPGIPVTAQVQPDETVEPKMVATPVTEEPSSQGGSRLALGLVIAAVVAVILLTVTGYAAWRFGAIEGLKAMIAGQPADADQSAQADLDLPAMALDVGASTQGEPDTPSIDDASADEHGAVYQKSQAASASGVTEVGSETRPESASQPKAETPARTTASPNDLRPRAPSSHSTSAQAPAPPPPTIGTGVALISVGETLLAGVAEDFVRQTLERRGVDVFDAMAVPGVAAVTESAADGGPSLMDLLRPHARFLIVVRADYTGDRELNYLGRYDREFQARLHLVAHDLLDGRKLGPGIHGPIGYTQLTVDRKVADMLGPKFRKIAGRLSE